jgi:lipoprotein-releasing system ATP-binding protein
VLLAESVARHYDTPRGPLPILDNVSLTLNPGDSVAIMGPSGSGKSTLLHILGALEAPSAGTVTLNGTNPYTLADREQAAFRGANIGFVFQDHLLLPQLTALDNVLAPTLVVTGDRAAFSNRARTLLTNIGLADRLDHRPAELSGGERQRVAIARALIRQPALLLCDEPTGNLDRSAADGVADLLASQHEDGKTMVVVVTHSPALAERFARRYEVNNRTLVQLTTNK